MVAVVKNGKILIYGADNPWRLAARIRKAGHAVDVHGNTGHDRSRFYIVVQGTNRDAIDRILAAE